MESNNEKKNQVKLKQKISDLAIFGGQPLFAQPLHVGRPNIGNRERLNERFDKILDSLWLSNNGPLVQEFEHLIENYIGVKHCIAVCNATIGLEIAIKSLNLTGEVIVPSFTFIATAHALKWLGIDPVFCDIEPKTHNIDPNKVEDLITSRTSGIIGVHVWGRPCDVDKLAEISDRYNLHLIYDAAHAFGCSYNGNMIGNFGDLEVFSFHATKFLNTFEGGAIVTNDDALATKIRHMKNFGFSGYDTVVSIGTNGKMNELSAAMGITGLESLNELILTNYNNYLSYKKYLSGIPGVTLISPNIGDKSNYQYIVIEIDDSITNISRDDLHDILHGENVLVRKYFYPGCHNMEPYVSLNPDAKKTLQETRKLIHRVMTLPNGTSIGETDIIGICKIITLVLNNAKEVNSLLNTRFQIYES